MDLAITIILGVLMLFMSAYGGHVSSKNKKQQAIFWIVGCICLILLVVQALRINNYQEKLDKKLSSISEDTKDIKNQGNELPTISKKELEIRQKELELSYAVSVDMVHDPGTQQLRIYNRGKSNIYLWGTKLGDGQRVIDKEPRIISPTPESFYYLLTNNLEKRIHEVFPLNGETYIPFDIFLTNIQSQKYIVNFKLWVVVTDGKITIHTQNINIAKVDWSKTK